MIRREQPIKTFFDLGALSLAGAAAAGVHDLIGPSSATAQVLTGLPAALAAYAVASGAVSVVMWFVRGEKPYVAWREQFAWLWPHYLAFGALAATMVGVELRLGPWSLLIFAIPVLALWVAEEQYLRRTRESVRLLRENNTALQEANARITELLVESHESTLMTMATLGRALHARDPEHAGSTERIARLARLARTIGVELGLSEDDVHALNIGVVVHDIGNVALRPGEHDDARCAELSEHILAPLRLPDIVMDMARHHADRLVARDGRPGRRLVAHQLELRLRRRPPRRQHAGRPVADLLESHQLEPDQLVAHLLEPDLMVGELREVTSVMPTSSVQRVTTRRGRGRVLGVMTPFGPTS